MKKIRKVNIKQVANVASKVQKPGMGGGVGDFAPCCTCEGECCCEWTCDEVCGCDPIGSCKPADKVINVMKVGRVGNKLQNKLKK